MTRLTKIAITTAIFFGVLLSQEKMTFSQWGIGSAYPTSVPFQASTSPLGLSPLLANPLLTNSLLTNPLLANPLLANPLLANPLLTNPLLANPLLANPLLANPLLANPLLTNPLTEPFGYTGLPLSGLAGNGQTWPTSATVFSNPASLANFPAQTLSRNLNQTPYPSTYQSPYPNGVLPGASLLQANPPFGSVPNTAYSQGVVSPYPLYNNPSGFPYSNSSVPSNNPSVPPLSGYNPYSGYLASQGLPVSNYPVSSYPSQGLPVSGYPYSSVPYSTALYSGLYNPGTGFYTPPSDTGQQQSEQESNSDDDSQSSDSTSTQATSPAQVTGVWIGTWNVSFASQQGQVTSAASINLAQADTSVSGAFLFVGHSTINGLSANGVVEGNNLQMIASTGENDAKLTISFEGEVKGDTWSGEYLITNKTGAALEVGQFVVSRVM